MHTDAQSTRPVQEERSNQTVADSTTVWKRDLCVVTTTEDGETTCLFLPPSGRSSASHSSRETNRPNSPDSKSSDSDSSYEDRSVSDDPPSFMIRGQFDSWFQNEHAEEDRGSHSPEITGRLPGSPRIPQISLSHAEPPPKQRGASAQEGRLNVADGDGEFSDYEMLSSSLCRSEQDLEASLDPAELIVDRAALLARR